MSESLHETQLLTVTGNGQLSPISDELILWYNDGEVCQLTHQDLYLSSQRDRLAILLPLLPILLPGGRYTEK